MAVPLRAGYRFCPETRIVIAGAIELETPGIQLASLATQMMFMRRLGSLLAIVLALLAPTLAIAGGDRLVASTTSEDPPIPAWARIIPPEPSIPPEVAAFSGRWDGRWRPGPYASLIVLQIHPMNNKGQYPVDALYTWSSVNIKSIWTAQPGFIEPTGVIKNGALVLTYRDLTLEYRLLESSQELEAKHSTFRSIQRYGTFVHYQMP